MKYSLRSAKPAYPTPAQILKNVENSFYAPVKKQLSPIIYDIQDISFGTRVDFWLRELVQEVTATHATASDEIRAMEWVYFLRKALRHNCFPLLMVTGQQMYNPIRLLMDGISQCGQTARLVVDGLNAIGIPARVLQLKGHVSAEFFAGNRWVFAEADILGERENMLNANGNLVSIEDIQENKNLLKAVVPMPTQGPNCQHILERDWRIEADSDWVEAFEPITYPQSSLTTPYVIRKTSKNPQNSIYFGWDSYQFEARGGKI